MASRDERMDLGWDLLEQGEYEGAIEIAEALLEESADDLEAMFLAGSALFEIGEHEEAAERLRQVIRLEPANAAARLTLAAVLYETCDFDEALGEVGSAMASEPESAYAQYLNGLLLDMKGRHDEADACFLKASKLDPEHYREPSSLTRSEFERVVEQALATLPAQFLDRLGNVPILIEEVPGPALLASLEDPEPDLLGLFVGTPLPEASLQDLPRAPDAVYLFKRNLERAASDREELVEEIRVTLLHEIGHFLGLDEDDLEEAGYA
ncbi:MAG TPA: metallopeptidase family protein [Patescibacteria group bacterium]|jgi:predicted Zn-dependent protease with MMP-like domain|nr:metallopeptidase family protein [Patescibacteria group bacterium]